MSLQPLLQRLQVVQEQLTSKAPLERQQATWRELCVLPYVLGAMHHAVVQMHLFQDHLFEEMASVDLTGTAKYGPPHELSAPIAYAIDSFLDTARRTQNALIPYLSRGFRTALPSSLSDVIKAVEQKKLTIDPSVDGLLVHYWQGGGGRLKDYRDTCQHHALLAAEAVVFRDTAGQIGLRLVLPSNPEDKTARALLYGDPPIHAVPYVRSEFVRLVAFTSLIVSFLENTIPGNLTPTTFLFAFEGLVFGSQVRNQGHKQLAMSTLSKDVERRLVHCLESFKRQAVQKQGDDA